MLSRLRGGGGKTFLLTQWRRECLSLGAVVAWLTLDAHDDAERFVHGLAAAMAIGSGRSSFARAVERMPGKGGDELEGLTQWLAEVADLGSETVLILNEADTLLEVTVRHSLTYLLHNAPANLRIMMASRGRLNLQVADLMASGRYATITTPTLRLAVEETVGILNARFGALIDTDLCVRLHGITEGWPLGLQLAISAMEKSRNLRAAIEELSTCSGDIQRYFLANQRLQPNGDVRFELSKEIGDKSQFGGFLIDRPKGGARRADIACAHFVELLADGPQYVFGELMDCVLYSALFFGQRCFKACQSNIR
ncbi:MAG: LuxR family ATP-dependent transcriptional regulator [Pseudomonas sp.]|nr:LuxR family ATP-dependent transcriptional regulator [Pseudomonas sp.]